MELVAKTQFLWVGKPENKGNEIPHRKAFTNMLYLQNVLIYMWLKHLAENQYIQYSSTYSTAVHTNKQPILGQSNDGFSPHQYQIRFWANNAVLHKILQKASFYKITLKFIIKEKGTIKPRSKKYLDIPIASTFQCQGA